MFKREVISNIVRKDIDEEDQDREKSMLDEALSREEWEAAMKNDQDAERADAHDRHELWLQYKAWEMDNRLFGPDKKGDESAEKKLFINRDSNDDGLGETPSDDLYRRFIRDNRKRSKSGERAVK